MNDASDEWPCHFSVTFSDDEYRAFHKLMAGRYARAQNDGTAFGLLLAAIFVLGLAVFAAFKLGLFTPSAVRPVLFTAYFAFMTGLLGYYLVIRAYFRKFFRTHRRGGMWNFSFDDVGIRYNTDTIEVRTTWRAVDSVDDFGRIVVFCFGAQGIGLPARVFTNNEVRVAFVAAAAVRIKAAAQSL